MARGYRCAVVPCTAAPRLLQRREGRRYDDPVLHPAQLERRQPQLPCGDGPSPDRARRRGAPGELGLAAVAIPILGAVLAVAGIGLTDDSCRRVFAIGLVGGLIVWLIVISPTLAAATGRFLGEAVRSWRS